jgi:hypothetical protein
MFCKCNKNNHRKRTYFINLFMTGHSCINCSLSIYFSLSYYHHIITLLENKFKGNYSNILSHEKKMYLCSVIISELYLKSIVRNARTAGRNIRTAVRSVRAIVKIE